MPSTPDVPAEGGCDCRAVRYRLASAPLVVHCCHCRWCQRESGASFALNAMIEADRVMSLGIEPEVVLTPSESGAGQRVARCPRCKVAVWSHYAGSGPVMRFVRVGTLDDPDRFPPDVHIFTASKQPWVQLPADTPAFPEFYDREALWPASSLERRKAVLPAIEAYQASRRGEGSNDPIAMTSHEPQHQPRVGIGVIVRREGKVLLGLRRGSHGAGTWALPGGHLEFGESFEACAAREAAEETGLSVTIEGIGPCTNDVMPAEHRHYVTVFVLAASEAGTPEVLEPTKCERWAWFDWQALPEPLFLPLRHLVASGFVPGDGAARARGQDDHLGPR